MFGNPTEHHMTATEKLKQKLIHMVTGKTVKTAAKVKEKYGELHDADRLDDALCELRGSGVSTGLESPYSRHYESEAVAAQMLDGTWVGWAHWYGGGKHGEPESIPWLEDAYDVVMEEVMQPVKVFRLAEAAPVPE